MRNIRLTLAYDGGNYLGWQVQPNGPSVQAVVEDAILNLTGETVRVLTAGRTDAGVHALGQVANFRTNCCIPCENIRRGLQCHLPRDVVVLHVDEVPREFHSTYWAKRKRYRYVIHQSLVRSPFLERYVWWRSDNFDFERMQRGADHLKGTHDFRCFESHFPNKATSVRTVMEAKFFRAGGWAVWNGCSIAEQQPADGSKDTPFLVSKLWPMDSSIIWCERLWAHWSKWGGESGRRRMCKKSSKRKAERLPGKRLRQGLYLVSVDYDESESKA